MKLEIKILLILLTYLWGSIPVGYILTKAYTGKNILKYGSENIGSTNVMRIAGRKISFATQLLDILKGILPVTLFLLFKNTLSSYYIYLLAITTIIGHDFSIFLKFRGGKGVNTTLGASLLIAPYSVIIAVAVYFIVKWKYKFVSIGSILLGISLPTVELILNQFSQVFYYLLVCSILITITHGKNIQRLIQGKEIPL